MSLTGKDVSIKISGAGVLATDLTTATNDYQTYQIEDELRQVIALDTPIVVKNHGEKTDEKYKVNRLNGTITFETADETREVTVDCTYLPLIKVAEAHTVSFTEGVDLHEVPRFGDEYKRRIPGLKYASGSLAHWNILDSTFHDALISGNPVLIEYKHSESGKTNRLFAYLESVEMSLAIDNPHEQSVSFISTDEFIRY
jgi:hypothetical protein